MEISEQHLINTWWLLNPKEVIPPTVTEIEAVRKYVTTAEQQISDTQREIEKLRRKNVSHA